MALMVTPVSRAASPILTLAIIRRPVDGEASRQVDRRAGECAPAIRHREHRGVGSWLSRPFGAGATLAGKAMVGGYCVGEGVGRGAIRLTDLPVIRVRSQG